MSRQREREEFLVALAKEGVPMERELGWALLRYARTLHRLAEAQCNGDWPADNGQRPTAACHVCDSLWAPEAIRDQKCPDCRTKAAVRQLLDGTGIEPIFSGDPREAVLKLRLPSGRTNDWGQTGFCVPS